MSLNSQDLKTIGHRPEYVETQSEKTTMRERGLTAESRLRRSENERRWGWRARLTFPTQQELHAKDRNPRADLSAHSPATLAVLLLAQLTH